MTDRLRYTLINDRDRYFAKRAIDQAPAGHHVEVRPPTRSLEANAKLWACLTEISEQVIWHGQKLDPEAWKDMATAALKRQRVVPGIDGGFVVLGQRTSKMTVSEMSELIEFLHAFGARHDVIFRDQRVAA